MKKIFNKIKLSHWPIFFLTIVLSLVFLLFLFTEKYIYTIIAFTIICFASFKLKVKRFPIILFIVSMLTKLLVILIINPPIESDFLVMYEASKSLAVGDNSYVNLPYFITWSYQTGHVVYQALLLKIIESVFFLKLINCLALTGTTMLIYYIVKEILNEKVARFSSLSYMFYLHPVLLTTVLTNQHVPTFLFFLALYFIVKDDFFKSKPVVKYLLSGILIGIGNIMRPEGTVFILTIIVYLICICYKKEKFKVLLPKVLLVLASYLVITKGTAFMFESLNISKNGLSNQDPLWKLVLGTNYESQGRYNENDLIYLGNEKKEMEIIKERTIKNPLQFSKLLAIKAKSFWTGNNLFWSNDYLNREDLKIASHKISGQKVNEYLSAINEHVYLITFILALIGLCSILKRKYDKRVNLFIILLSGYFVIYSFIEIMNRYTYTPRVSIFILAGFGANYIYEKNKEYLVTKK